jgi:hypothetical protein
MAESPLVTINGSPVVSGAVHLPRTGVWSANLVVDQDTAVTGRVTVEIAGGLTLNGTASRSGVSDGCAVLRVLAGSAALSRPVPPKYFRLIPARQVLEHILRSVGEELAPSSDASLVRRQLQAHCQKRMSASAALSSLVEDLGGVWRALPDGTIWVGLESWPAASSPGELLDEQPHAQCSTYGADAPGLLPGTSVDGRKVGAVEHLVGEDVRTVVTWETNPDGVDRQTRAILAMVRHATARLDYCKRFSGKVVAQNADETLELQLDDEDMPGLTRVPIRYGVPGIRAEVAKGAAVDVSFEGGDPSAPMVTGFAPGSLVALRADSSADIVVNGGSQQVARKGDTVHAGYLSGQAGPYPVTFVYVPHVEGGPPVPAATALSGGHVTSGAEHFKG